MRSTATRERPVRCWGPGSLSNLGPGFDALGICLAGLGDVVEVWPEEAGIHVVPGSGPWEPPGEVARNTAARAARAAAEQLGLQGGFGIRVTKGLLPGSGLGSSAASAVAGAWAMHLLMDDAGDKRDAIGAILEGERAATASVHGDNVVPSLLGGAVLVYPDDPARFRRIPLPQELCFVVVRPEGSVLTADARAVLPASVPLRDSVGNGASLAFLVDALRSGDLEAAGKAMMEDRIVERARTALVPVFPPMRAAAVEAGALGCALSGSGPTVVALAPDRAAAGVIMDAMVQASFDGGRSAVGAVAFVDHEGARETELKRPETTI